MAEIPTYFKFLLRCHLPRDPSLASLSPEAFLFSSCIHILLNPLFFSLAHVTTWYIVHLIIVYSCSAPLWHLDPSYLVHCISAGMWYCLHTMKLLNKYIQQRIGSWAGISWLPNETVRYASILLVLKLRVKGEKWFVQVWWPGLTVNLTRSIVT